MDAFTTQTQDYYLSQEDAEQLTHRRLPYQFLGRSTSALEVFEEELNGLPVVVKRFKVEEDRSPSLGTIMDALAKWRHVSPHPNIMPFLGLCPDAHSPLPMLITRHVPWSLLQYIKTHPSASKHALVYSIATALEYIHSQEITHGNVKAGNVLVDRDGIVYLSDIGIFQAVTSPGPMALVNELRWSAPEKVLREEEHTPACDVWSFGMTVIEMYTGASPFQYFPLETVVTAMTIGELPEEASNLMDRSLWNLVLGCLRYAAEDRPPMDSVCRSLRQIY